MNEGKHRKKRCLNLRMRTKEIDDQHFSFKAEKHAGRLIARKAEKVNYEKLSRIKNRQIQLRKGNKTSDSRKSGVAFQSNVCVCFQLSFQQRRRRTAPSQNYSIRFLQIMD